MFVSVEDVLYVAIRDVRGGEETGFYHLRFLVTLCRRRSAWVLRESR